jgi:hypothetical protein
VACGKAHNDGARPDSISGQRAMRRGAGAPVVCLLFFGHVPLRVGETLGESSARPLAASAASQCLQVINYHFFSTSPLYDRRRAVFRPHDASQALMNQRLVPKSSTTQGVLISFGSASATFGRPRASSTLSRQRAAKQAKSEGAKRSSTAWGALHGRWEKTATACPRRHETNGRPRDAHVDSRENETSR